MSNGSIRLVAYTVASLLLIGLSRIWPTAAAWLAIAATTGVLLSHSDEFVVISNRVIQAFGGTFGQAPGGPVPPIQVPGPFTNPHAIQE